jgi:hypothetical protein
MQSPNGERLKLDLAVHNLRLRSDCPEQSSGTLRRDSASACGHRQL